MTDIVKPEENDDLDRPPLGLPPGSVRAILSILIAAQFWMLLCLRNQIEGIIVPLNLYFLLSLVMIFFISHGSSISHAPGVGNPLYLPRGAIRLLLVVGTIGVVAYQYQLDPERLFARLTPKPDQLKQFPSLLGVTFLGFVLGTLLRKLPTYRSPFLQNLRAWFSLLAAAGMFVEVFIQCLINPHIGTELNFAVWQLILTGVVSYYFSLRA